MAGSPVIGPDGAGAQPTGPAVRVAGTYNGLVTPIAVDANGKLTLSPTTTSEQQLLGSDGSTLADVLASAPGSDTGQHGLAVRIISSLAGGAGGTSSQDGATYTAASTSGTPAMGAFDDVATALVTEGKLGIARITSYRAIHVNLRDNSGAEVAVGGGTQYDEDAASAGGEKLTLAGAVRQDTIASSLSADGDYGYLKLNSVGRLYVAATVDAALPAGANAIGKLAANDGVDIGDVTINNASLAVTLAAGATAIAKAEDVASADADVGVPALAVRKATPANTSGTDGDYEFLQMSAGRLWVDGSGVTLTVGSHAVTNAGTFAVQAAITAASGAIASGAVASGAVASGAFASGSIAAGAVAAGATSFVKLEDVASADADAGVPALAVRKATPANTSGSDGDYEFLQISAGRLWASANIDQINGVTPLMGAGNTGTGSLRVTVASDQAVIATGGDVANDGANSGNPLQVGGVARTAPTGVSATGDRVAAMFDLYGKQIVRESLREDLGNQATTITSSTSETTIVTADGTYKLDLYCLILSNTSATATKVTLKDSTAGTTRGIFYVPAGDMRGFSVSPSGAHKQNAANNNWTLTCGTSIATLEVTALFTRSL